MAFLSTLLSGVSLGPIIWSYPISSSCLLTPGSGGSGFLFSPG